MGVRSVLFFGKSEYFVGQCISAFVTTFWIEIRGFSHLDLIFRSKMGF